MSLNRVSDLAQSQLLISLLNQASTKLDTTQFQVSSGKNAQYFSDLADQAGVLYSAKRVLDRNTSYTQTTTQLQQKLDTQNLALTNLESIADGLNQDVTGAVGNASGLSLMDQINSVFQSAVSQLNTQVDGQYIFGGTRTDVAPVNISTLDQLGAAPTIAGIFENNDTKPSAVVNDGVTVQYGFTASDLGTALMTTLQAIKQFNDTNPDGPFGQTLTDGQMTFLQNQLSNLKQITTDMTASSAQNGVIQNQVDAVQTQLANTNTSATQFVSDIEDADLPTALSNLQQDQMALQAATQVVAQIGQVSLLDYLPIT